MQRSRKHLNLAEVSFFLLHPLLDIIFKYESCQRSEIHEELAEISSNLIIYRPDENMGPEDEEIDKNADHVKQDDHMEGDNAEKKEEDNMGGEQEEEMDTMVKDEILGFENTEENEILSFENTEENEILSFENMEEDDDGDDDESFAVETPTEVVPSDDEADHEDPSWTWPTWILLILTGATVSSSAAMLL